jgi:predicted DCC family thiol-disulfide oxidoreductase YuxK
VRFLRKHDKNFRFRFVPIHSEEADRLILETGLEQEGSGTMIYASDGRYYLRSSAVLNILKDMGGAWKLFYCLIIIPQPVRDFLYKLVAKYRYRIFGRHITRK